METIEMQIYLGPIEWGMLATFWAIFVVAGMHLLPEEVEKLDGAANFRQVFMDLRELTDLRSNWFHDFGELNWFC